MCSRYSVLVASLHGKAVPKFMSFFLILGGILILSPLLSAQCVLKTNHVSILVEKGSISSLKSLESGTEYLAPNQPAPVMQVQVGDTLFAPSGMVWKKSAGRMTLSYDAAGVTAEVKVKAKSTHVVLELLSIEPKDKVEVILWGPYPTIIGEMIGETVGVVRDKTFALGIQTLNVRTLGGAPHIDAGMPDRLEPAAHTDFGSHLRAYCCDRTKEHFIANWGHEKYLVPAFDDGGVVGSKIALFGSSANMALDTIGKIELAEGLPHPMMDGVWAKVNRRASESYLIIDYGEDTIDTAIALAQRSGLHYIYHSSPFETWGHFKLKPDFFPNGDAGMRTCAEKAKKAGVHIGFHTLSNFITPNDPYITPKPDHRLAKVGWTALSTDVTTSQTEIPIEDPTFLRKTTPMNTAMIGDELIRYEAISDKKPWHLLKCQRGAWGTIAAPHAKDDRVGKMMDHEYKVFLTNANLSQEVARNMADLCNRTGVSMCSLDGLEGNYSAGMQEYGNALFTYAWYNRLSDELRGHVVNDASNGGHCNWHIYTRMNWGEPWYAGFRESQIEGRLANQLYFRRNLMPSMLGWFLLTHDSSIEDMEWLLARAAGFDAGFALVMSGESLAQKEAAGHLDKVLSELGPVDEFMEAVQQWEKARLTQAFPDSLRPALQDTKKEFHLKATGADSWLLYPLYTVKAKSNSGDQGAASYAELEVNNPYKTQPLQIDIKCTGTVATASLNIEINGKEALAYAGTIAPGETVKYAGEGKMTIYDQHWKVRTIVDVDPKPLGIGEGKQIVRVGCQSASADKPALNVELKTIDEPTAIQSKKGK